MSYDWQPVVSQIRTASFRGSASDRDAVQPLPPAQHVRPAADQRASQSLRASVFPGAAWERLRRLLSLFSIAFAGLVIAASISRTASAQLMVAGNPVGDDDQA